MSATNSPSNTQPVLSPSKSALELHHIKWPTLLPFHSSNVANPSIRWRLGSRLVVPGVGLFSKFWMTVANTSTVHNATVFHNALDVNYRSNKQSMLTTPQDVLPTATDSLISVAAESRESECTSATPNGRRPLITYSNHASCLDDPLMWGALIPFKWQFNSDRHRWSAAAAEVCFSKPWHSIFFSLGKTFPIIRGDGNCIFGYIGNVNSKYFIKEFTNQRWSTRSVSCPMVNGCTSFPKAKLFHGRTIAIQNF